MNISTTIHTSKLSAKLLRLQVKEKPRKKSLKTYICKNKEELPQVYLKLKRRLKSFYFVMHYIKSYDHLQMQYSGFKMLASNEDSKLTFTVFHNNNHGVI
jgi:hypothetical protein